MDMEWMNCFFKTRLSIPIGECQTARQHNQNCLHLTKIQIPITEQNLVSSPSRPVVQSQLLKNREICPNERRGYAV
jgi:hypothetical protein